MSNLSSKDKSSYKYYYNKIMLNKRISPKYGDVYKKVSNENIFKTLPGIQGAIYLIKKVTNKEGRWNKARKWIGAAHGTIVIKYERIKKNGNVPIYLDEKPLTANFYNWGKWNYDFMFVGKIWNVEGEPHIEFLEDMARRMAYEDPNNKEEWKLRRKEREEAEARKKWLNSDEGRSWQERRGERKGRFLRRMELYFYKERTYPNTIEGKLVQEEEKLWKKEYDRQEAEARERERKTKEEARKREQQEEARKREREEWVRRKAERDAEAKRKKDLRRRERMDNPNEGQDEDSDSDDESDRGGYAPWQQRWYFAARPKLKF
jgi:hypothetical protein